MSVYVRCEARQEAPVPNSFQNVLLRPRQVSDKVNFWYVCLKNAIFVSESVSGTNNPRWLIERETPHFTFISCISVTWVSPRPRPFRRLETVFSPFNRLGQMNVITDYDKFFHPLCHQDTNWTHFSQTHIFRTFWPKMAFFRHTNQEKINFVQHLFLSQQHTQICEPVLPTLFHNGHKRTLTWSYRWNLN